MQFRGKWTERERERDQCFKAETSRRCALNGHSPPELQKFQVALSNSHHQTCETLRDCGDASLKRDSLSLRLDETRHTIVLLALSSPDSAPPLSSLVLFIFFHVPKVFWSRRGQRVRSS